MTLFVLTSGYPTPEGGVLCGFVHARCIEYAKLGINVRVYVYFGKRPDYQIDGITVFHRPMNSIFEEIKQFKPDACAIHFPVREFCEAYQMHRPDMPFGLWFHGVETLSWKRRLFNMEINYRFVRFMLDNTRQLYSLRRFLMSESSNPRLRLVYVSKWMHDIAEKDLHLSIPHYQTIPNPIDCSLFSYQPKPPEQRWRVLLLRNFSSRKYANDLAVKAIETLSRTDPSVFSKMEFAIYGEGRLFHSLTACLSSFSNVTCQERLFTREDIPHLHKDKGIFLCPTRQDAQGVSMCEAMASGLVPITSYNTAIPEFVTHLKDGLLTRSVREIASSLSILAQDPVLFNKLSASAAARMRQQCEASAVAKQELRALDLYP